MTISRFPSPRPFKLGHLTMVKKLIYFLLLFLMPSESLWAESIVVIVNKGNPTDSLSLNEVQRLFLLESRVWPHGGRIQPINRDKGSDAKKDFVQSVLKMTPEDYGQHWIGVKQLSGETEPKSVRSNKFVLKIVSKNKNTIGYLPEKYLDKLSATSRSKIKTVLKIEN